MGKDQESAVREIGKQATFRARAAAGIQPLLGATQSHLLWGWILYLFDRLWRFMGLKQIIEKLLENRKFLFSVERAIFLTVLHRLFAPGSDRQADKWKEDFRIEGVEGLQLHHAYRAMAWLGEELSITEQTGATGFAPRCTKDRIEEMLFNQHQDLFSSLELVFFDTTSIYFEGQGGESIGRLGKTKDWRPDLKQMVVGVVLDGEGRPSISQNVTAIGRAVIGAHRMVSAASAYEILVNSYPGAALKARLDAPKDKIGRGVDFDLEHVSRCTKEYNPVEDYRVLSGRIDQLKAKMTLLNEVEDAPEPKGAQVKNKKKASRTTRAGRKHP